MSDLDMNEVNAQMEAIAEQYTDETYLQRLKKLFVGIKAPRNSKEYKEAMLELQRLSAPLLAVLLPTLMVGLLIIMTEGSNTKDRVIETQIMEAEEIKDLEEVKELETPPETTEEMSVDVPLNAPNVQTSSDVPNNAPMSPQPQTFDAVQTVKSPVILKNIYGSTRNTGTRGAQLARFGGDKKTEDAVLRALRWLKKTQNADGSWNKAKGAMTALAVLTFLAHGEKPGDSAEFGPTVQKALEYLIKSQNPTTGRLPGNYDQPMATYALCEAYGMTLNPNVKSAAEKALVWIIKGQHPTGGWNYNLDPNPNKNKDHGAIGSYRDDTSYMGWCAQALKAAKLARIHVEGLEKAVKLSVKGFKNNAGPNGGFGYTGPGASGLTSVGTLCMQLLGASNEKEVKLSLDLMDAWKPSMEDKAPPIPGGAIQYYLYYATQCKFHAGGKRWETWNRDMKPLYVAAQKIEKNGIKNEKGLDCDIGWWENKDAHGDRPVMDTCLVALQLMVYYRYLPTTSKEAVVVEEEIKASASDKEDIVIDSGNL